MMNTRGKNPKSPAGKAAKVNAAQAKLDKKARSKKLMNAGAAVSSGTQDNSEVNKTNRKARAASLQNRLGNGIHI